jgi:hypothetical protein
MRVLPWIVTGALTVAATLLPLRVSADGAVSVNAAECTGGTCCPELKSDCIINNILTQNNYAKLTGDRCKAAEVRPASG